MCLRTVKTSSPSETDRPVYLCVYLSNPSQTESAERNLTGSLLALVQGESRLSEPSSERCTCFVFLGTFSSAMLNRQVLSPVGRRVVQSSHRVSHARCSSCVTRLHLLCNNMRPQHISAPAFTVTDYRTPLASDYRYTDTKEATPHPKARPLLSRGYCHLLHRQHLRRVQEPDIP